MNKFAHTIALLALSTLAVDSFAVTPVKTPVVKSAQTITFGSAPTIVAKGKGTVTVTASSNLTAALTTSTPKVCSVASMSVTSLTAGTCTIVANQSGNALFTAAPSATIAIVIPPTTQTVTITKPISTSLILGTSLVLKATSTSALPVVLTSSTPSICTIAAGTIKAIATGDCVINANVAASAVYDASAPTSQTLSIIPKTTQTITFDSVLTLNVKSLGVVNANSTSELKVSLSTSTPGVCTVTDGIVTVHAAGSCVIVADQAGNATYSPATRVTETIVIPQSPQTITFSAIPATSVIVGSSLTLKATSDSGLSVALTSSTPTICTFSAGVVKALADGTCIINANQVGSANYAAATTTSQNITLSAKSPQTITFGAVPTVLLGNNGAISATSTSLLPVNFTTTTPTVCRLGTMVVSTPGSQSYTTSIVTAAAAGTCTIAANQVGNVAFKSATTVTQAIVIEQAGQTLVFMPIPSTSIVVGTTVSVKASSFKTVTSGVASATALVPVLISATPGTCSIVSGTVKALVAGACTINASQAGTVNYTAATTTSLNLTVVPKSVQTLTFGPTPTIAAKGKGILTVTSSAGLPVVLVSATPKICTVSAGIVTDLIKGTCTINANQVGTTIFNSASISLNITI
jgi:hypothetical protein